MSDQLPSCPECDSEYTYENSGLLVCPMCAHEWTSTDDDATSGEQSDAEFVVKDAFGNTLEDGDTVMIAKDVKVQGGGGGGLKSGTKVRGIRLNPHGANGHDIDARVPGFGRMQLKSSVVKKVV